MSAITESVMTNQEASTEPPLTGMSKEDRESLREEMEKNKNEKKKLIWILNINTYQSIQFNLQSQIQSSISNSICNLKIQFVI